MTSTLLMHKNSLVYYCDAIIFFLHPCMVLLFCSICTYTMQCNVIWESMFRELWIYLGFDLGMFLVGVMLRKAIHWFLVSLDFLTPAGVTGGRGCGLGFFWFLPFLVLQSSLAVKSLVLVSLKFGYPLLEYRYQYLFSYLRKYVAPCKWTSKYH